MTRRNTFRGCWHLIDHIRDSLADERWDYRICALALPTELSGGPRRTQRAARTTLRSPPTDGNTRHRQMLHTVVAATHHAKIDPGWPFAVTSGSLPDDSVLKEDS
jgi:hypothetical protein